MKALLEQANHRLHPRDLLSIHRTMLGNTRTLLAMIRTAIAFLAVGAGFLRFLTHTFFHMMAHVLITGSVVVILFGIINFYFYRKSIAKVLIRELDKPNNAS